MNLVEYFLHGTLLPFYFAFAWDLAVITKDEIQFFQEDKQVGVAGEYLREMLIGAYDPLRGELFIGDCNQRNASIFRMNLLNDNGTDAAAAAGFQPIVEKQYPWIQGIAFDPVNSALFWSTGKGHTIRKMVVDKSSNPTSSVVLHNFTHEIPQGIAVDSCKQHLYWANGNHSSPSIERSSTNGSDRRIIVKGNLFQPMGIVIDEPEEKLYWSDESEGIYYALERVNLDGSGREMIMRGTHHTPFSVAVVGDSLYWTDWANDALWALPKWTTGGVEPRVVKKFQYKEVKSVVANAHWIMRANEKNCSALMPFKKKIEENLSKSLLKKSAPYVNSKVEANELECLNAGTVVGNTCKCSPGYGGARCELSNCHNYCLSGACALTADGTPVCSCPGYAGERCQFQRSVLDILCDSYCGVSRSPAKDAEKLCRCLEGTSQKYPGAFVRTESPPMANFDDVNALVSTSLSITCLVLVAIVICLSRKVCNMRKRPRIKKRIILPAPRPLCASQPTPEQCEITIENCCNMNICETPCFGPDFHSSTATFSKSKCGTKSEDKKNLIGCSLQSINSQDELY